MRFRFPFALRSTVDTLAAEVRSERALFTAEHEAHSRTRSAARAEIDKMRDFIASKLEGLTQLEPVVRYPVPTNNIHFAVDETARATAIEIIEGKRRDVVIRVMIPAVFDWWNYRQDYGAIDDAIRYVAEVVGVQVARELRFGLTRKR